MFISKEEKLETNRRIEVIESKLNDLLEALNPSDIKNQINDLKQEVSGFKQKVEILHVGVVEITRRTNNLFDTKKLMQEINDKEALKKQRQLKKLAEQRREARLARNREYARKYYQRKQAEKKAIQAAQMATQLEQVA